MSTDSNIHKRAMIEALEKSLGVVTTAAKQAKINRKTHYEWLKEDPDYKAQVEDVANIALDFAESQLHKQIQDGEVSSTIFFLKTKGKGRGYIERQEFAGVEGSPLVWKETKVYDSEQKADNSSGLPGGQ
jgi:hypothetical protein